MSKRMYQLILDVDLEEMKPHEISEDFLGYIQTLDVRQLIEQIIADLNVHFTKKAENRLKEIILYSLQNEHSLKNLCKDFYPHFMKEFGCCYSTCRGIFVDLFNELKSSQNLELLDDICGDSMTNIPSKYFLTQLVSYINRILIKQEAICIRISECNSSIQYVTEPKAYQSTAFKNSYEILIDDVLTGFNLNPVNSRYKYVKKAILLCIENPKLLTAFHNELYPLIADYYGTTTVGVASGVNHLIHSIVPNDLFYEIFGSRTNSVNKKFFVSAIIDYVKKGRVIFAGSLSNTFYHDYFMDMHLSTSKLIDAIFDTLDIARNSKSYLYFKEAILFSLQSPELLASFVDKLYPALSRKFDKSLENIRGSIKYLVATKIMPQNKHPLYKEIWGYATSLELPVKVCITGIVDYINKIYS